ncbi:hypothetical protein [Methylopila sp. M107]|uniref:hypothetical protein n=1 Tax=Methylopila sp. M107 TaxID=1101190 RepID=UPI0003A3E42D|nr:hypothetical protein [Methylopila sp. M107]
MRFEAASERLADRMLEVRDNANTQANVQSRSKEKRRPYEIVRRGGSRTLRAKRGDQSFNKKPPTGTLMCVLDFIQMF